MTTQKELYRFFLKPQKAKENNKGNAKAQQILMDIARERQTKAEEDAKRKEIEDRLDASSKDYIDTMKAIEIMEQIDAEREE